MSSRLLQRRAAKAAKRKKQLAERHKADGVAPKSIAARARHGAARPIYRCLMQKTMFAIGSGIVLLARGAPSDGFIVASFLVDTFCLGVKDSFLHHDLDERDVESLIATTEMAAPLEPVAPSYARKLLHEAVAYSRSNGIPPHQDFAAIDALFGDAAADATATFQFGYEGRPLYLPSEDETPAQVRRRLDALTKTLGKDGFDMELPVDDSASELLYDPEIGPDPELWLEADEAERMEWVMAYHREEDGHGMAELEKQEMHAALHAAVESEIASNEPPAARHALERLLAEGLDRHDAIHAIANRLLFEMVDCTREDRDFSNVAYETALDALTAESWRAEEPE
ncbi:MAG TPA: hypothetical protein VHX19_09370 [Stellaceae bacterium]|jgi:hypothetical protein|nr:hypothetical protein [Stellaceae bacterium]